MGCLGDVPSVSGAGQLTSLRSQVHAAPDADSGGSRISGVMDSGRGGARAEHAQGSPTQSHVSPSRIVYEDNFILTLNLKSQAPTPKGTR